MHSVLALLVGLMAAAGSPAFAGTGLQVPDPGRGFARDRVVEGFECIGAVGGAVSTYETCNQHAFVAQGCVMHIWDCGTPGSPRELSWVKFPSYINTIAISYPAVYVATQYKCVQVLDISDPAHPKYMRDLEAGGGSLELSAYAVGNALYVVEDGKYGNSFFIYNISKPLSPRLVHGGRRNDIEKFATNGRKFFAFGYYNENDRPTLGVMDIDDAKTTFATVATFPVADSYDNFQFAVTKDGLLFDPGPTNVTLKLLPAAESKNLVVNGDTYAAEPKSPTAPCVHEKDYRWIEESQARLCADQVKLADGKAYLRGEDGWFTILDVKDPASPAVLSQYQHPAGLVSFAVEGDLLYIYDTSRTLTCLSAPPSPKPEVLSRLELPATIGQMVAQGHLLLLTTDAGLRVYDFAQPRAPKLAGEFKTESKCFDVVTSGTQAIVATNAAINVIDLSTPSRPNLVRELRVSGLEADEECYEYRLKRLGDSLYVISISIMDGQLCELAVLDLNNLDATPRLVESPVEIWEGENEIKPSTVKNPTRPGWVLGLPVSYSQTSGGQSGMNLFDLADPVAPRLCGQYWRLSRHLKHDPVLFKDCIYIADGENGLLILRETGQEK